MLRQDLLLLADGLILVLRECHALILRAVILRWLHTHGIWDGRGASLSVNDFAKEAIIVALDLLGRGQLEGKVGEEEAYAHEEHDLSKAQLQVSSRAMNVEELWRHTGEREAGS